MSTEDYEVLYSPSKWNKRYPPDQILAKHVQLLSEASDKAKATIPNELDVQYGNHERQKYDVYGTDLPADAPIFIYIHGGYWQVEAIRREMSAFMVANLHKKGIKSIVIGYELCPKVTLQELIRGIETAIRKCLDYAARNNARKIALCGHSAGAHLVANLFTDFVPNLKDEEKQKIKAAFLIAGVYDLTPLLKTSFNGALELDADSSKRFSPMFQPIGAAKGTKFHVYVGRNDTPKFLEQSEALHEKLVKEGVDSKFMVFEDVDHYNIVENLIDENYEITKAITNF